VAGKADYMSPEQADFQVTDKRSDIFSTGVVLGNLLLGYNVFKGSNAEESRDRIMTLPCPIILKSIHSSTIGSMRFCIAPWHAIWPNVTRRRTNCSTIWSITFTIKGYGPTNETLGKFIREAFGQSIPNTAATRGETTLLERPNPASAQAG